jgi:hypothetical protein
MQHLEGSGTPVLYIGRTVLLIPLMWNIGRVPNNVSKWQMGFNSAFKGLKVHIYDSTSLNYSYNEKCFDKMCKENQNTRSKSFFSKVVTFMK